MGNNQNQVNCRSRTEVENVAMLPPNGFFKSISTALSSDGLEPSCPEHFDNSTAASKRPKRNSRKKLKKKKRKHPFGLENHSVESNVSSSVFSTRSPEVFLSPLDDYTSISFSNEKNYNFCCTSRLQSGTGSPLGVESGNSSDSYHSCLSLYMESCDDLSWLDCSVDVDNTFFRSLSRKPSRSDDDFHSVIDGDIDASHEYDSTTISCDIKKGNGSPVQQKVQMNLSGYSQQKGDFVRPALHCSDDIEYLFRTVDGSSKNSDPKKFEHESFLGCEKINIQKLSDCQCFQIEMQAMWNLENNISIVGGTGSCCSSCLIVPNNEDQYNLLIPHTISLGKLALVEPTSTGDDSASRKCAEESLGWIKKSPISLVSSDDTETTSHHSSSSDSTYLGLPHSDYEENGSLIFENRNSCASCRKQRGYCTSPQTHGSCRAEPIDEFKYSPLACGEFCIVCNSSYGLSLNNQSTDLVASALEKMLHAVSVSYKIQSVSESVSHNHLAKIEEFLECASPVFEQPKCWKLNSTSCSQCQLICESASPHRFLTLGNLWKWYEKPGNYGLEVKLDSFAFLLEAQSEESKLRAYFVPYLSAIQLFGRSKNSSFAEVNKLCSSTETFSKYNLEGTPFFVPLYGSCSCSVEISSSITSEDFHQLNEGGSCTEELLFEYFESELPQYRKPFYEKIKDILLIRNALSYNQTDGDPLKLDFLRICDVHPSSWYSVAWYPIYQIPEGNFRASFLTYHSLGLFSSKGPPKSSKHFVSPVVGLLSYIAEVESWFKMPDYVSNSDVNVGLCRSPSEVLDERLQALAQAATAMSTASVRKGDTVSTNKHPDYEFFLSRRRYKDR